jgi:hypothetical protein
METEQYLQLCQALKANQKYDHFMMSSCILYKHYRIQINGANIYEVIVYRAILIYFISFQLYEVLIL